MPHRCTHHANGDQCTFYLSDADTSALCPLHRERGPLLAGIRRLLLSIRRRRVIAHATCLYLDPSNRLFRGTLRPGALVRVLAAPAAGWMQVEVLNAAGLPARARGWVKRCALQ